MKNTTQAKYLHYKYILLILLLPIIGCDNTNYISSIPDYSVNLQLNLNTEYATFISPGDYKIFTERKLEMDRIGFGGILVYLGLDGYEYYAYDLACPYEAKKDIRVIPDGLHATCPECGESYDISYGYGIPTKGICKESLKRYKVRKRNNILYITLK